MRNMDIQDVYTLFEEIKGLIKKGSGNIPTIVQSEIELPDLSAISELTNKLHETIEEVRKPIKNECHHTFSIASNKIFFSVIGMGIALLVCMFTIYYQREEIATYKDNDLKYRYVKMQGGASDKTLLKLEANFTYNRSKDSISVIRQQVELYERLVREQAEKTEQAKFNSGEAERLQKEAEKVKQK